MDVFGTIVMKGIKERVVKDRESKRGIASCVVFGKYIHKDFI